jgi:cytochrome P450 family 9
MNPTHDLAIYFEVLLDLGERWRDMRATLSPAFTSSKMRNMFQFIEEIGRHMAEFYLNEMKLTENKSEANLTEFFYY